jgi:hypothetical protein
MSRISKGTRVRMSKLGAERCPRIADKHGVVVGGGYYDTVVRVLFDSSRSPVSLHRDYLENARTGSQESSSLGSPVLERGAAAEAGALKKILGGEQPIRTSPRDGDWE